MLTIEDIEAFKEDNLETGRKASPGIAGAGNDAGTDCGRDGQIGAAGEKSTGTSEGMAPRSTRAERRHQERWLRYLYGSAWLA